ncbi:MAG: hypothetical protein NVS9B15_07910 [Acidobacteriaceae bacterium]
MLATVRTLSWICLIVWIGGIIFFSAVEAPAVFHVLGAADLRHLAGDIVSSSLAALHYMGLLFGAIFLGCDFASRNLMRASNSASQVISRSSRLALPAVLVGLMMLLTAFSQFWITPGMHLVRQSNPQLEQMLPSASARVQFDRLHRYSTFAEGAVLLLGLAVVALRATDSRRDSSPIN